MDAELKEVLLEVKHMVEALDVKITELQKEFEELKQILRN